MSFFYDLNKKLDGIRATPEVTHQQLNERDEGKPGKNFAKIAKDAGERYGSKAAGERVAGAVRNKLKAQGKLEEGPLDTVKKIGKKVASGVNKLVGHGSDEEMRQDLQRKAGVPQTGKKPTPPQQVKEKLSPAKQKSFAALAPPRDKITFADKIAGAKKEVDEMLGDVAAEAMRKAVGGGHGRNAEMDEEKSKGTAFDMSTPRASTPKVGSVERGHKHDIKHTATGRIVTRRTDDQGNSVGADDDSAASGEKRGRGRPKGTKQSIGAKGPSGKSKLMTKENDIHSDDSEEYDQEGEMAQQDLSSAEDAIESLRSILTADENLPEWVQAKITKAVDYLDTSSDYMKNKDAGEESEENEELDEKAVSKQQQKFMGMAHAMQKGKKIPGASKELKKVAKTMKPKDTHDFAATKHKGLPEKVKSKKKKEEEVEESTTSGSVATSTASSGSKGGVFGKGIYDSMNRELEKMIAESMSINMSDSTEGGKSLTITATDEDALKLAVMLKSAGLGGQGRELQSDDHAHSEEPCETCGMSDCGCGDVHEAVDENQPDYPTNTETSANALQYSGGLNKPKASGMATIPVTDVSLDGEDKFSKAVHEEDSLSRMMEMAGIRQAELEPWKETMKETADDTCGDCHKDPCECDESVEESIQRMREIAGIKEAKKPDFLDMDKDGNKKEPMTKAIKDKEEKKVEESIFALTNQWKAYRG